MLIEFLETQPCPHKNHPIRDPKPLKLGILLDSLGGFHLMYVKILSTTISREKIILKLVDMEPRKSNCAHGHSTLCDVTIQYS